MLRARGALAHGSQQRGTHRCLLALCAKRHDHASRAVGQQQFAARLQPGPIDERRGEIAEGKHGTNGQRLARRLHGVDGAVGEAADDGQSRRSRWRRRLGPCFRGNHAPRARVELHGDSVLRVAEPAQRDPRALALEGHAAARRVLAAQRFDAREERLQAILLALERARQRVAPRIRHDARSGNGLSRQTVTRRAVGEEREHADRRDIQGHQDERRSRADRERSHERYLLLATECGES